MDSPNAARAGILLEEASLSKSAQETDKTPSPSAKFTLHAHVLGKVVALQDVPDEVFANKLLGEGIAIDPSDDRLLAPCDGVVADITPTSHAVNFLADDGTEILLHVGIDTVKLNGRGFEVIAKKGQHVRRGELLLRFDRQIIREAGFSLITPMVVCQRKTGILLTPGQTVGPDTPVLEVMD